MNFDFSDDRKALKSEARRFKEANASTEQVRKGLDDAAKPGGLQGLAAGRPASQNDLSSSVYWEDLWDCWTTRWC